LFHRSWPKTTPKITETQVKLAPRRGGIAKAGRPTTSLGGSCTSPYEVQNEKHYTDDEKEVNQTNADVKCEKPKQPEHNQNQCN
jgi:hypothetical protein